MSRADTVVELVQYDSAWPQRFALARDELVKVVPRAEVEHIGSTSVPGLSSKDTIDIALGVAATLNSEVLNGLGQPPTNMFPLPSLTTLTTRSSSELTRLTGPSICT